jgi:hydrogenase maturation protein HypF
MHPAYLSTSWAKEWALEKHLPLLAVQHHHAHIAGCMAEHALEGPVIGLSLDGTGFGTDGRIWGGEVLIARFHRFDRFAHLEYVPMPGGEAAIREPWRMAFGALYASGADLQNQGMLHLLGASERQSALLSRMIEHSVNCPLTSSCGRLFDAAAAIILQQRAVDYEGQAAIMLEGIAVDEPDEDNGYPMTLSAGNWSRLDPAILSAKPLWHALLADVSSGISSSRVAARFHAGIAKGFVEAAVRASEATGIREVVLSGGCMHNRRLTRLLRAGLQERAFKIFQNRRISPGDGGLSYGQSVVAAAILRKREVGEHE